MRQDVQSHMRVLPALVLMAVLAAGCGEGDQTLKAAAVNPSSTTIEAAHSDLTSTTELGPIGGGLSSGTGLDVDLACPPGIAVETTEWFGPTGRSMEGAVQEAFGDLVVHWIGEPELLGEVAGWATWGTRLDDGTLIAAVTLVRTDQGWDPSHAEFCVIREPQPDRPPLTFYVSNQSFEDPSVTISVTIDGEVVVDERFDVEGQHNWKSFELDVPEGEYLLQAVSDTGVVFDTTVTIESDTPLWAVLDYWWYPDDESRHFTFSTSTEPMAFG